MCGHKDMGTCQLIDNGSIVSIQLFKKTIFYTIVRFGITVLARTEYTVKIRRKHEN